MEGGGGGQLATCGGDPARATLYLVGGGVASDHITPRQEETLEVSKPLQVEAGTERRLISGWDVHEAEEWEEVGGSPPRDPFSRQGAVQLT